MKNMDMIRGMRTIAFLAMFVSMVYPQTFMVNTEKSSLTWKAEKLTGKHDGGLRLRGGTVLIKDNKIVSGKIEADMTSIKNFDIESEKYRVRLENHLRSPDFFSTDSFPTAVFNFKSGGIIEKNTYLLKGDMVIKGIVSPVEFKAEITLNDMAAKATGTVVLDRTKWNVRHRSAYFFPDIGDRVIYDDFIVGFELIAERE